MWEGNNAEKVTIVTGPIVGLKSSAFLEDTAIREDSRRKIVIFNLFTEILDQCGVKTKNAYQEILEISNLLNGYEYQFECMRQKAYLSTARKIEALDKNTSAIIRTPASIEWRGYNLVLKRPTCRRDKAGPHCYAH
jgi:hypothetical protein